MARWSDIRDYINWRKRQPPKPLTPEQEEANRRFSEALREAMEDIKRRHNLRRPK